MVRNLQESDVEYIKEVWSKHFKDQFEFPDFYTGFINSFTVFGEDKIVAVAGVKPILESIIVLDKDLSPRIRGKALYEILNVSRFIGRKHGFDHLHAFIQEEPYLKTMLNRGFRKTKGQSVVIDI